MSIVRRRSGRDGDALRPVPNEPSPQVQALASFALDALFVEASEPGRPGTVVAHRYDGTREGTAALGEPVALGHGSPLL